MFFAYYCEGCSAAPPIQYKNNEIKQESTKEKDYFGEDSDERLYIDMRHSKGYTKELEKLSRDDGSVTLTIKLKQAAAKRVRLRFIAYSQAEYCYFSTKNGYMVTYKDYSIA